MSCGGKTYEKEKQLLQMLANVSDIIIIITHTQLRVCVTNHQCEMFASFDNL